MPYMPLMMICWAPAVAATARTPAAKSPAKSLRFIRPSFRSSRVERAGPDARPRRSLRLAGRREVLEDCLYRLLGLSPVGARAGDLILGGPAPHHLVGLGVDQVHDERSDRDVRLGGRGHPAHAAPAAVAEAAHARGVPLLLAR